MLSAFAIMSSIEPVSARFSVIAINGNNTSLVRAHNLSRGWHRGLALNGFCPGAPVAVSVVLMKPEHWQALFAMAGVEP